MLNVMFVGDTLAKDQFPMRGIPQTLLREWARVKNEELHFIYVKDDVSPDQLQAADVIIIMISDGWSRNFYDIVNYETFSFEHKVVIGYTTELLDVWNRKSTYEYFNYYHQYAYRKGLECGLFAILDGVIAPSIAKVPFHNSIPIVYYPFLYAPSVYADKITYMRKLIAANPRLSGEFKERNISMVYKLGSIFRDKFSEELDKQVPITYGGKYKNNDDGVKGGYEFDIIEDYYTKFNFNLAIENEFAWTYWTEKSINPLLADSVPIYYDPFDFYYNFLNKDAMILFNDRDFEQKFEEVKELCNPSNYYARFNNVPILNSMAESVFEADIRDAIKELDKILCRR